MDKYIPDFVLEKRIDTRSCVKIRRQIENILNEKHMGPYLDDGNRDRYFKKTNESLRKIILCNSKNNKEEFLKFLETFNTSSVFIIADVYIGILFISVIFKNEDFIEILKNHKKLVYPYPLYEPKNLTEKSIKMVRDVMETWDSSTEKKIIFQR